MLIKFPHRTGQPCNKIAMGATYAAVGDVACCQKLGNRNSLNVTSGAATRWVVANSLRIQPQFPQSIRKLSQSACCAMAHMPPYCCSEYRSVRQASKQMKACFRQTACLDVVLRLSINALPAAVARRLLRVNSGCFNCSSGGQGRHGAELIYQRSLSWPANCSCSANDRQRQSP